MELLSTDDRLVELLRQDRGLLAHFGHAVDQLPRTGGEEPRLGTGLAGGAAGVDKLGGGDCGDGGGGGFRGAAPAAGCVEVGGRGDDGADDQRHEEEDRRDPVAGAGGGQAHALRKYCSDRGEMW